jgi:hypothetical protein
MSDKLRKSVRTYRHMLATMPLDSRSPEFRQVLAYLRSLYAEFSRAEVRKALTEFEA